MHEMSLAENIMQIIEEKALEQKFNRVRTVSLEIGQLACVEQESLRFYFDVVKQGGIAQQAKLEIIEIAGQARCNQCDCNVSVAEHYAACPHCGNYALQVIQGDGMQIKELEVE